VVRTDAERSTLPRCCADSAGTEGLRRLAEIYQELQQANDGPSHLTSKGGPPQTGSTEHGRRADPLGSRDHEGRSVMSPRGPPVRPS